MSYGDIVSELKSKVNAIAPFIHQLPLQPEAQLSIAYAHVV